MPKDDGLDLALQGSTDHETLSLYGGDVTLFYNDKLHAYWREIDGERILVPGVTTVTSMIDKSGPLTQWAANSTVQHILENLITALHIPTGTQKVADIVVEKARQFYQAVKDKIDVTNAQAPMVVISPAKFAVLLNTARFNYRAISKDATDVGHEAHKWLEGYIKYMIERGFYSFEDIEAAYIVDNPKPTEQRALNCVNAALSWLHKHKVKPLASERKIYSRLFNYSGTEDFEGSLTACGNHNCCPYDGEVLFIADFKSSKTIYDEYRLQLAAYHQARTEEDPEFGNAVGARIILRLGKDDGEFESLAVTQAQFEMDTDGFLSTLGMYCWAKQHELTKRGDKAAAKYLAKASKPPKKPAKKTAKVNIPTALIGDQEIGIPTGGIPDGV